MLGMMSLDNNMNIQERIDKLEKIYGCGTILSRCFNPNPKQEPSYIWCLGLGKISMPKSFYHGNTIEEVFYNAENNINKQKTWEDLFSENNLDSSINL